MYSCNWMFNVAEAGTYVIDTQTTTTFTIVSALVKYYDTTKPDISTCTVRLNSASSVSGIINETLQNKDVVIVQNVPFRITGGREHLNLLRLHARSPLRLPFRKSSVNRQLP